MMMRIMDRGARGCKQMLKLKHSSGITAKKTVTTKKKLNKINKANSTNDVSMIRDMRYHPYSHLYITIIF